MVSLFSLNISANMIPQSCGYMGEMGCGGRRDVRGKGGESSPEVGRGAGRQGGLAIDDGSGRWVRKL